MNLIPVAVAVCAGLVFGHASSSAVATCQAKMTAFPLDPGSKCCTHGDDYKIVPGTLAQIDQHPWAALIVYDRKTGESKPLCSGTLISGKYVLTAAHCIVGQVLHIATPKNVRLGDYDYNHEGPDCVAGTNEDCNDGAVSIEIESTIPHPKYAYPHPSKWNDIGLIRMKKTAPFTDFIRPICLPTTNLETNPPEHSLHVVSWYQKTGSGIKSLYEVPFYGQEGCKEIYSRKKVVLAEGQICAGGLEGMDACKGDGGGPLVNVNKDGSVELTGIVSFGPSPCGQKNFPSVYTNVYVYLDWIKSVIVE
ncbi:hypothetical protein PYW07_010594 [Mythimna separata]|uniref:Peptidase S1 domain-containing protein n=1 Tax=Mythimna separata TaxID=271217 RepID=A0AAD7YAN9_MYTSE|nr:hypothetical protein PYW07_010594 [Mythimna separata]